MSTEWTKWGQRMEFFDTICGSDRRFCFFDFPSTIGVDENGRSVSKQNLFSRRMM